MPWPRKHHRGRGAFFLLLLLATAPAPAAPPPAAPKPSPGASAPAMPDYGGRDSAPLGGAGEGTPNPAAQAGHALEALVVVLAGVAAVVYALKRFGLVQPGVNGRPARIGLPLAGRLSAAVSGPSSVPLTVESSQALPGGAMLHVVSIGERTFLLAATPHNVTAVAEWPAESGAGVDDTTFADYLDRADSGPQTSSQADAPSRVAAANARLRSLLERTQGDDRP